MHAGHKTSIKVFKNKIFGILYNYYNNKSGSKFLTEKCKKHGTICSDERKIVHLEKLKHVWAN